MEMLQKDAELERLRAVENERSKWEAKEGRLLRQLDEALKRSKRAEELSERVHQCKENALLQSSDESLSYSGLAVPSSGSETGGRSLQDFSSEHLPASVSLFTPHSTAVQVLNTTINSTEFQSASFDPETRPYPVTATLGCDSICGMTDVMTSTNLTQHSVMITQSTGLSSHQLPSFSTVTSTTWSLPVMSMREPYSMVTEPSVLWTGQGLPVFAGLGQRVTSRQTSRENYLNVPGRINVSAQSLPVTSSNQGAIVSSPSNLGVLTNQILPLPKFSGEVDSSKGDSESFTDWKEKFEMVAEAYHWDDSTKLVNLVTRSCGRAYSFYRSCDGNQRSCYTNLVEQLVRRFTSVRIGAVQSIVCSTTDARERKNL